MEVPEGFQVDLLAAEPDLVQPIAMCFDARGRIWVVEGNTYPTRATKPPARADGDGDLSKPNAAQKADIFAGKDRKNQAWACICFVSVFRRKLALYAASSRDWD